MHSREQHKTAKRLIDTKNATKSFARANGNIQPLSLLPTEKEIKKVKMRVAAPGTVPGTKISRANHRYRERQTGTTQKYVADRWGKPTPSRQSMALKHLSCG
ncbi:uncharacterized protein TrAFT101_000345 [Trichoderma asperellum]|uniref:uncharacterized protein n=1 Tax=Trichoderma asperellum TaxID=101201 RepID=UPI003331A2A1|nr:hypothetical protein TrAFT101_000345 [Trichoderma asperellum]